MSPNAIQVSGVALALTAFASSLQGQPFVPGCPLPFEAIKGQNLTIDQQCGSTGTADTAKGRRQNEVKNNFCAQGAPVKLSFGDFDRLMTRARQKHVPFGSNTNLPSNRSALKDILTLDDGTKIGEGDVVSLIGFVFGAQHSNTEFFIFHGVPGNGETVNCESGKLDMNDIHIQLVATESLVKPGKECKSVTAEISPHFRPAAWDRFDINPITNVHLSAPPLPLRRAKVRLTGQLFFDANHSPCKNGKGVRGSTARRSIWEIHPVYAIEVFDTAQNQFVPLDVFAQNH